MRIFVLAEHLHLLHAGPSQPTSHSALNFVCSMTHSYITYWGKFARPPPQIMSQLPMEHVTPNPVSDLSPIAVSLIEVPPPQVMDQLPLKHVTPNAVSDLSHIAVSFIDVSTPDLHLRWWVSYPWNVVLYLKPCSINDIYGMTYWHKSPRPPPQMIYQLPMKRSTPKAVFDKVVVDYARQVYVKQGSVWKPTIIKAYICVSFHHLSRRFGVGTKFNLGSLQCLPEACYCSLQHTILDLEWSWNQFCLCWNAFSKSCLNSFSSGRQRKLFQSFARVKAYTWTNISFWWSMGGLCQNNTPEWTPDLGVLREADV